MFSFDFDKSLQACAFLLRDSANSSMSMLRLMKLMYIADRECIRDTGRPITGDRAVSMDKGPVLSRLYDIMKGEHSLSPEWHKFIHKDGYELCLVDDPGNGRLSRFEAEKLTELLERYHDKDEWQIIQETHEFSEWQDPDGSSVPISTEDILAALGMSERVEAIRQDAAALADVRRALEG